MLDFGGVQSYLFAAGSAGFPSLFYLALSATLESFCEGDFGEASLSSRIDNSIIVYTGILSRVKSINF
jgi:hypothetical protein